MIISFLFAKFFSCTIVDECNLHIFSKRYNTQLQAFYLTLVMLFSQRIFLYQETTYILSPSSIYYLHFEFTFVMLSYISV